MVSHSQPLSDSWFAHTGICPAPLATIICYPGDAFSACICVSLYFPGDLVFFSFFFICCFERIESMPVLMGSRGCPVVRRCCCHNGVGRRWQGLLCDWMWSFGAQGKSSLSASAQLLQGHGHPVHLALLLLRLLWLMTICFCWQLASCFFWSRAGFCVYFSC